MVTEHDSTGLTDTEAIIVRRRGLVEYEATWQAMREFTVRRTAMTPDELWLVQHPPVYTTGVAGRQAQLPQHTEIPVLRIDRGGQITYHGPGQLIAYLLLDLRRRGITVRPLVRMMESAVIKLLGELGIEASFRADAPGVYVGESKVAALGLRIRNGCSYHGLALNVDMDLTPFNAIDACGYPGLAVTQLRHLGVNLKPEELEPMLIRHLLEALQ